MPEEVENLLQVIALKQLCRQAGIMKLDCGTKGAVLTFHNHNFANLTGLIQYAQKYSNNIKLRPDQRLVFLAVWKNQTQKMQGVAAFLRDLVKLAEG